MLSTQRENSDISILHTHKHVLTFIPRKTSLKKHKRNDRSIDNIISFLSGNSTISVRKYGTIERVLRQIRENNI